MELCHVISEVGWQEARRMGQLAPGADESFLHCCTEAQLEFVLHRHFAQTAGLLVLMFDATAVTDTLRWVESEPGLAAFPHLHGSLPVAAVLRVLQVGV